MRLKLRKHHKTVLSILLFSLTTVVFATNAGKCGTGQAIQNFIRRGKSITSPELPFSLSTSHFKLWYDTTGVDKIYPEDTDSNGIPDYIERAGEYLEYSWYILIDSLGYREPLPDTLWLPDTADYGGDEKVDVYFIYMGPGLYGMTEPRDSASDSISTKATAYIKIQSDMTRLENYPDDPYAPLKVTCAHEFFHTVQFAYRFPNSTNYSNFIWWMEATAVFNEEFCFDQVNDYYLYLKEFQEYPENPLFVIEAGTVLEYGAVMFPIFLEEFFSTSGARFSGQIIKRIWEVCEYEIPLNATDIVLDEMGTSLNEVYETFTYWRMRTGQHWQPEFFAEGAEYPLPLSDTITTLESDYYDECMLKPLATKFYLLPYSDDENGVLARISSSSEFVSFGLGVITIEISESSPMGEFEIAPPDIFTGVAGRWQYRAIVFSPLIYSAPYPTDITINIQSSDSLAIPLTMENTIGHPFPNPTTGEYVKFPIDIITPTDINVRIFTADGTRIWKYGEHISLPDYLEIQWDCCNENNTSVSPGVYIYFIQTGNKSQMGKIFIAK